MIGALLILFSLGVMFSVCCHVLKTVLLDDLRKNLCMFYPCPQVSDFNCVGCFEFVRENLKIINGTIDEIRLWNRTLSSEEIYS